MLDWQYYPHIFDSIYSHLDGESLDVVRRTCQSLRDRAETDLWEHVTLSPKILMASPSDSESRPEAVVLTLTQLYSTRHGTPLPAVYRNGHNKITRKTVTVLHPSIDGCESDWDGCDHFAEFGCPTAQHLTDIADCLAFDVAVRLDATNTLHCNDLVLLHCRAPFRSFVSFHRLAGDPEHKPTDYIRLSAPRNIVSLAYACTGVQDPYVELMSPVGWCPHVLTIVLRPECVCGGSAGALPSDPAYLHPSGVDWFVRRLVPAADGSLCRKITFVAVESWPPDACPELRRPTPHTTKRAFEKALRAHRDFLNVAEPHNLHTLENVEVIDWAQLRERAGDDVCGLLASDPPSLGQLGV